jgi:hypothetical protein
MKVSERTIERRIPGTGGFYEGRVCKDRKPSCPYVLCEKGRNSCVKACSLRSDIPRAKPQASKREKYGNILSIYKSR